MPRHQLQWTLVLSCLFVLALACTRSFQQEIDTVKQLQERIEVSKKKFDQIDSAQISAAYFRARGKIATIQNTYSLSGDTLLRDKAKLLKQYANLIGPLGKAPLVYTRTRSEIILTEKILSNLKHDLQRNLLSEESVKTALIEERNAVEQIEAAILHLDSAMAAANSAVPDLNNRIDSALHFNNIPVE